jgi:hypothetical protein
MSKRRHIVYVYNKNTREMQNDWRTRTCYMDSPCRVHYLVFGFGERIRTPYRQRNHASLDAA